MTLWVVGIDYLDRLIWLSEQSVVRLNVMIFNTTAAVLQLLECRLPPQTRIWVKRDDLIDPLVSGNKWRKLKYHSQRFNELGKQSIITFGGAYSNHLVATAKYCALAGIAAVGIVRGHELNVASNPTLAMCQRLGMQLRFVTRAEYAQRYEPDYLAQLQENNPTAYIVPEGGGGYWGALGCREILTEIKAVKFDYIYLAAGTGTTAAGVLAAMPLSSRLVAVSALKGDFMRRNILTLAAQLLAAAQLKRQERRLQVYDDELWGGYGRVSSQLLEFIAWCRQELALPLDKIYTAKAFWRLWHDVQQQRISGQILFIHTGGLQGNSDFYATSTNQPS